MSLTPEAKNDLRKRVLEGYRLTEEEAAAIIADARGARRAAADAAANSAKKPSKSRKKTMSDEELDADLDLFISKGKNGTSNPGSTSAAAANSPAGSRDSAPDLDLS